MKPGRNKPVLLHDSDQFQVICLPVRLLPPSSPLRVSPLSHLAAPAEPPSRRDAQISHLRLEPAGVEQKKQLDLLKSLKYHPDSSQFSEKIRNSTELLQKKSQWNSWSH